MYESNGRATGYNMLSSLGVDNEAMICHPSWV